MNEILLTSAALILVILLARWLFRGRVSQRLIYSAWLLVAVRLLVPVQLFDFQFSILQTAEPVTQVITQISTTPVAGPSRDQVFDQIVQDYIEKDTTVFVPEVQEQIKVEISQGTQSPSEIFDKIQQQRPKEEILIPEVQQQVAQQVEESITMPTVGQIALAVWIAGMALMALWFLFVNLRHGYGLRRDAQSMECSESPVPVRISSKVNSPCLVGFFRPVVYMTPASAESPQTLKHVLAHELTHLGHWDHIWSLVRCICLCIYWFNPLVWLAAYLSRRDCELACDEGALKRLGEQERIAYGKTLLEVVSHASSPMQLLQTATSMNETRKQLTERVNFIVKKPKFIITAAICMVLICAIAVGCAFTGAPESQTPGAQLNDPTSTASTPTVTPTVSVPPTNGSIIDYGSINVEWMEWNYDLESLVDRVDYIFEGKVVDISFEVQSMIPWDEDADDYLAVYTLYEIEVERTYKGNTDPTETLVVLGGYPGKYEEEQIAALNEKGIYSNEVGIQENLIFLEEGASYMFTLRGSGQYMKIPNGTQFAFEIDENEIVKDPSVPSYKTIKKYVTVPLTFEEIMAIPSYYNPAVDYIWTDETLGDFINFSQLVNVPMALVKATCLDIQYYVRWENGHTGFSYTKYTFLITEIAQKYNDAEIEVNGIVEITQMSYLSPKNDSDMKAFFENHGAKPDANAENRLGLNIQEGDYELVPVQGVEYRNYRYYDEPPMCIGESYTFGLFTDSGTALYVYPADDNSHLIVNDYYDLEFSPYYFQIATEIAQLFTEENEQE